MVSFKYQHRQERYVVSVVFVLFIFAFAFILFVYFVHLFYTNSTKVNSYYV